ncbi:hypothetical protein IG611_15370 [Pectobacterium sp. A535-S3-A17]|uniref:hypothetical protein n=1 Tax=Pectobacterium quasiaquaticum TaxID=2774015 RepID=UPI001874E504|nr:hypothetical protein [Pectobacterium quasiaquaticum]MBE5226724.1 hypothetical protein [Pectobacterium quasiaquaticum]
MDKKIQYFILSPTYMVPLSSKKASRYLPFLGRIMSDGEWKSCGFDIKKDKFGHPVRAKIGDAHSFRRVLLLSDSYAEREAIDQHKRLYTGIHSLLDYVKVGISFDEFTTHPIHVQNYCLAKMAWESNDLELSIQLFRAALTDDPQNITYLSDYYKVRIENDDLKAINEELIEFSHEIDSCVHSGRVDTWLTKLFLYKEYAFAAKITLQVDALLMKSISGELPPGRYSSQSKDFIINKQKQFKDKVRKLCNSSRYSIYRKELESLDYQWD